MLLPQLFDPVTKGIDPDPFCRGKRRQDALLRKDHRAEIVFRRPDILHKSKSRIHIGIPEHRIFQIQHRRIGGKHGKIPFRRKAIAVPHRKSVRIRIDLLPQFLPVDHRDLMSFECLRQFLPDDQIGIDHHTRQFFHLQGF